MEEHLKHDGELKHQLLLEQYRQAAEEYRAEDRNMWQPFAILLALNGVLVAFLDFDSTSGFSIQVILSAIIGMVSACAGVLIIGRTQLYQRQRVLTAEKIQNLTGIIHLYFHEPIQDYMKRVYPNEYIHWDERAGGRKMMQRVFMILGFMWFILLVYSFFPIIGCALGRLSSWLM